MSSSIKITFSTTSNQDSDIMTLAYISLLSLHITFSVLLMLTLRWKFGVFLILSKAFNRVWHEGLLYKLKSNGTYGNLFKLIKSFLNNRCRRSFLNGQSSVWKSFTVGVPQGSVLGPLFFLIYINDLPLDLTINIKLFADDTSLFSVVNTPVFLPLD